MTRICKLEGCTLPVSGPRAEFCKPAHRAAYWRSRHVVAVVQEPGPRSGANARSGRQVSYTKAVARLARYIEGTRAQSGASPLYMVSAEDLADMILREALPERQRERS